MRTIAILKKCLDNEKEIILSVTRKEDKVLFYDNEQELLENREYEGVEIVFGELEYSTVQLMKKLRWIQMSFAGANKYTSVPNFPDSITITSASGAYGHVISEYIISGILALKKNLFLYRKQMRNGDWHRIEGDDTLEGKRVLILGTGNIGYETAKKLKCFGCYTVGISRTLDKNLEYFDELYTNDTVDIQLQSADVVVIALPGTKETAEMFDEKRIVKMKESAILVNVGRGFIVNTEALTKALQQGVISGAVLDVTDPEPLPENHALRYMENVVLTPHISGISWGDNMYTRKRILEIFCENLKHDIFNEPKKNIIDLKKGY